MASFLLTTRLSSLRTIPPSPLLSRGAAPFGISLPTLQAKPFSGLATSIFPRSRRSSSIVSILTLAGGDSENFFTQSMATTEPVVSVDWLHANLRQPNVKVIDASWYMPDEQRNPIQEYEMAHIPGALFFDVDGISDRTSNLPNMLPSEEAFAAAVSDLCIENKDGVVVYDGKGIFSSARVWWLDPSHLKQNCNHISYEHLNRSSLI